MKPLGSRLLPCGHASVRVPDTTEPQRRVCRTCKQPYTVQLVPAEKASEMAGTPVFQIHFEEAS